MLQLPYKAIRIENRLKRPWLPFARGYAQSVTSGRNDIMHLVQLPPDLIQYIACKQR